MWWKGIHYHGRHEFIPRRTASHNHHRDDAAADPDGDDYFGDEAVWLPGQLASAPEGWVGDELGEDDSPEDVSGFDALDTGALDIGKEMDADTAPIEPPPTEAERGRWRSQNDDTEVLPRLQDIRPPSRPTPIRRPPWVERRDRR